MTIRALVGPEPGCPTGSHRIDPLEDEQQHLERQRPYSFPEGEHVDCSRRGFPETCHWPNARFAHFAYSAHSTLSATIRGGAHTDQFHSTARRARLLLHITGVQRTPPTPFARRSLVSQVVLQYLACAVSFVEARTQSDNANEVLIACSGSEIRGGLDGILTISASHIRAFYRPKYVAQYEYNIVREPFHILPTPAFGHTSQLLPYLGLPSHPLSHPAPPPGLPVK
jgi:hypothetical protein